MQQPPVTRLQDGREESARMAEGPGGNGKIGAQAQKPLEIATETHYHALKGLFLRFSAKF